MSRSPPCAAVAQTASTLGVAWWTARRDRFERGDGIAAVYQILEHREVAHDSVGSGAVPVVCWVSSLGGDADRRALDPGPRRWDPEAAVGHRAICRTTPLFWLA
jgi:hypothetical protein